MAKLGGYRWRLMAFLAVASFFEGYDSLTLSQVLPSLRSTMGLSTAAEGRVVAVVNLGTWLAFLLILRADRWGRRRLLSVTIAGYTIMTFLTGFAPNAVAFALLQMVARVFLIAEWATALVYAAEEFPKEQRGFALAAINGMSSIGAIVCALTVPTLLQQPWGWRTPYFVGIVPLLLLLWARRDLKESRRFDALDAARAQQPFTHILQTRYLRRLLQVASIWFLIYICTQNAVTFWKEFAMAERHFSDEMAAHSIGIAAVLAVPLTFLVGPLLDRLGRRPGAVLIFLGTAAGVFGAFGFHDRGWLTFSLVFAITGAAAVLPVINAFNTELFPTELRGDAVAWANNILGRIGYVLSPWVLGIFAAKVGWGAAIRATAVLPVLATVLVLWFFPETTARELEDTAALP